MPEKLVRDAEEKMKKAIEATQRDFATVRTGRASPTVLERVMVDYFGAPTPINQIASVSAPEPRQLVIAPWDKNMLGPLEKAIQKSDLNLTPTNDGQVIRINFPPLNEERRKEMTRLVHKKAEEHKVALRNIRRDTNEEVQKQKKAGNFSEDEAKRLGDQIQKLTDRYVDQVERMRAAKDEEIMEV
ncbi:MAG TPA: ribosome recycling factor [Armatimonadota bacterium]|nr:ribosome recycling factor [Armatimonadota bacterium]